jgi:hypothetical protein
VLTKSTSDSRITPTEDPISIQRKDADQFVLGPVYVTTSRLADEYVRHLTKRLLTKAFNTIDRESRKNHIKVNLMVLRAHAETITNRD